MSRAPSVTGAPLLLPSLILGMMAVAVVAGPLAFPSSYALPGPEAYASPSLGHWCGTDLNGRDLLLRILDGGRVSLAVGLCGAMISLLIGTSWGLVAGTARPGVDNLMMRAVDILYSVPRLIFILVLINAFNTRIQSAANACGWEWLVGSSRLVILILSLGVIEWLTMARIVRGQTLVLRERPFVAAARVLGACRTAILWRHILPNLAGILIVYLTLAVPSVIVDEAFLSFLGLGVQAPQSSWGSLLAEGAAAINPLRSAWWLILFPSLAMLAALLALYGLGDAMRRSLQAK
jgi:oligopeptide transport system permease protein